VSLNARAGGQVLGRQEEVRGGGHLRIRLQHLQGSRRPNPLQVLLVVLRSSPSPPLRSDLPNLLERVGRRTHATVAPCLIPDKLPRARPSASSRRPPPIAPDSTSVR
jgi:hypothetical protein